MKKILVLVFSLFICSVCRAEDCSQSGDCWSATYPSSLICSPSVQVTTSGVCRFLCTTNASFDGTNCACDAGYYRTLSGNYSSIGNTCTVCPSTWTCAGGNAEPYQLCSIYNPVLYDTGNTIYPNVVTACSCSHPASVACTPTCGTGYTAVANSGTSSLTHCLNNTYGSCTGGTCNPNTYIIDLTDTPGSGGIGSIREVYNTKWTNSVGTTITSVTVPTYLGYTFTGYWSGSGASPVISAGGALPSNTTFTANASLAAQWTANTINISYDGGVGGTGSAPSSPTSFVYDAVATAPANTYTRTGHTFAGWECTILPGVYCSSVGNDIDPSTHIVLGGGSIKNAAVSGSIKLTAQWTANVYTITLDNNGGSGTPATTANCSGNTCTCTAGTPCTLPGSGLTPPSNTIPYSFDGWNSAINGIGTDYGTSWDFSSSVTIYARWKKTIDFQDNHTPSTTYATQTCYHGGNLDLPPFSPLAESGFSAGDASWYQDNHGGTVAYAVPATALINCDADAIHSPVYPKWVYNVYYDGNGRDGGAAVPGVTLCTKNLNCDLTDIPSMTRTGYTLDMDNWYSNATGIGGTNYPDTGTINNPSGYITLFAKWTQCATGQWVNIVTNTCEDCPIGFYCPAGATSPTACPPGHTTSAINSTVITACYITAGSGGTWFCDDGGARCFQLPDLGSPANNIIHYQL